METLPLKCLMSSAGSSFPMRWYLTGGLAERAQGGLLQTRRVRRRTGHSHVICQAKDYAFQELLGAFRRMTGSSLLSDFQGFSRPSRLFPATEVNISTETSLDEILTSTRSDGFSSLYVVELQTSNDFGSSISNSNAALLICLIDVNGNSILQRISAAMPEFTGHAEEMSVSVPLRFQRGSIDKTAFKGPKMGKIEAFWIGLETGCWKLGGLSLTVIDLDQISFSSTEDHRQKQYSGQQYSFEAINILLGEGGDTSMAELRPTLVTELELDTLFHIGLSQSAPLSKELITTEESMREYADLKLSLLLYDAMLIFAGTSIAAFSTNAEVAQAFLAGGFCGFLYLLLLQKSVDGLSVPALPTVRTDEKVANMVRFFASSKGPISRLALVFALTIPIVKFGLGNTSAILTPQELLAGAAGFITCKVAVVWAALKPMNTSLKSK